jgi:hypothetical protein
MSQFAAPPKNQLLRAVKGVGGSVKGVLAESNWRADSHVRTLQMLEDLQNPGEWTGIVVAAGL